LARHLELSFDSVPIVLPEPKMAEAVMNEFHCKVPLIEQFA